MTWRAPSKPSCPTYTNAAKRPRASRATPTRRAAAQAVRSWRTAASSSTPTTRPTPREGCCSTRSTSCAFTNSVLWTRARNSRRSPAAHHTRPCASSRRVMRASGSRCSPSASPISTQTSAIWRSRYPRPRANTRTHARAKMSLTCLGLTGCRSTTRPVRWTRPSRTLSSFSATIPDCAAALRSISSAAALWCAARSRGDR